MKKAICLLVAAVVLVGPASAQGYETITEQQFEFRLDELEKERSNGMRLMFSGLVVSLAGFVGGTVFATLDGAARITEPTALWGAIGSYTVAGSGVAMSIWGFLHWKDRTDDYLETLRLRTRYWTLVRPR